jgi:hypothetical protein
MSLLFNYVDNMTSTLASILDHGNLQYAEPISKLVGTSNNIVTLPMPNLTTLSEDNIF